MRRHAAAQRLLLRACYARRARMQSLLRFFLRFMLQHPFLPFMDRRCPFASASAFITIDTPSLPPDYLSFATPLYIFDIERYILFTPIFFAH